MTKQQKQVLDFMRVFDQHLEVYPNIPNEHTQQLRLRLIDEEYYELVEAIHDRNLVEIADACADLMYVISGLANAYGFDLDPVCDEVHRSNMSKIGGKINSYGKLEKPSTYSPADIAKVLVPWRG